MVPDNCTKYEQNHHIRKIAIITQIWTTAACKIEFGCVPNLSSYGHFFSINFECCHISEKNVIFFHICYGYQVQCIAHACKKNSILLFAKSE